MNFLNIRPIRNLLIRLVVVLQTLVFISFFKIYFSINLAWADVIVAYWLQFASFRKKKNVYVCA